MINKIKSRVNNILERLTGYRLIKTDLFDPSAQNKWNLAAELAGTFLEGPLGKFVSADFKSQLGQDYLVASLFKFKRGGVFVEFGAADGFNLSNTWFLEKKLGWSGLLIEPSRRGFAQLQKNRECKLDNRCVFNVDGSMVKFVEIREGELSTLGDYVSSDSHGQHRLSNKVEEYYVETISLQTILTQYNLTKIDYLSIDTEGSEYIILKCFPFNQFEIGVLTVEHNYTKNQELLHNLLTQNGFQQVFKHLSRFDSWYVNRSYFGV